MADVTVEVSRTTIKFLVWLRSSYIGLSIPNEIKGSLIEEIEFGPDQDNAFDDYFTEATYNVAKMFISRQGDVEGSPYKKEGDTVTYRFKEGEPTLAQADVIKITLAKDVKDAVYLWITLSWLQLKGHEDKAAELALKYQRLATDIQGSIYRLHD